MSRILLLTFACMIWGLGFAATRWTFEVYDPYWSNALRFLLASSLTIPILLWRRALRFNRPVLLCSVFLFAGLQAQTIGIEGTTLAKSGFLTAFYAIFTPILLYLKTGVNYRKTYWFLVGLAFLGVAFLCELSWEGFNRGDAWLLLSALFFSLHIIAVDSYAQKVHPVDFNFQQVLLVGLMASAMAFSLQGMPPLWPLFEFSRLLSPSPILGFVILAFFSSMIAFTIQIYAQKRIRAHVVSLVFLSESVFSAFFGMIFFAEFLSPKGVIGASLVLLAVGLIPFASRFEKRPAESAIPA